MARRRALSRVFLIAALVMAAVIFTFSAQPGQTSSHLSDTLALRLTDLARPGASPGGPERLSIVQRLIPVVRKGAHLLEFALLGFNLAMGLGLRPGGRLPLGPGRLAWLAATAYAGTDELHQLFVVGRNAALVDVAIDSAGSLAGVLLAALCLALAARHRRLRQGDSGDVA